MQFGDDFILFASVFTFAAIYSMMMSNYRTWHLYIIWRRCEENKPLQVHTKNKFSDRNDDWLWSLMPHQCLRRSLDIQADCVIFVSVQRVFLVVINLVCGRIWSLACTVLLTTIRNGPQFFSCLYILTKKLEMACNFSLVGLTLRAWQTH